MTNCTHVHPAYDPNTGLITPTQCHAPEFIKVNNRALCTKHADLALRNGK